MAASSLRYVDHTYRDFSKYIDEGGHLIKHKKSEANFPAKLHKMISEPTNSSIITWMPHGRAFKVLDKETFFSEVLPKYLGCKKYESFTRQLNGWGFKRLYQSGPDLGSYYHECFLRGLPKLTCLILRLPNNMGRLVPYPAGEPNFYRISERYPVPPTSSLDESPAKVKEAKENDVPAATKASTLVDPTHGTSQQNVQDTPSRASLQPSQESFAGSASEIEATSESSRGHPQGKQSQESAADPEAISRDAPHHGPYDYDSVRHDRYSSARAFTQEHYVNAAGASLMSPEPPYQAPHYYRQDHHYHYHQPYRQSDYSYHASPQPHAGYSSQYGDTWGNYPAQGQPTEPQPFMPPPHSYDNYTAVPNTAPIERNVPSRSQDQTSSQGDNISTLDPLPYPNHTRQD
mmetsp:Transcript_5546/g.12065  ORF Transcript_5546/g.12065 Transcript_5546/m.12065 type:complete len:403 (-) Transcript_5546:1048-2256(-)